MLVAEGINAIIMLLDHNLISLSDDPVNETVFDFSNILL